MVSVKQLAILKMDDKKNMNPSFEHRHNAYKGEETHFQENVLYSVIENNVFSHTRKTLSGGVLL